MISSHINEHDPSSNVFQLSDHAIYVLNVSSLPEAAAAAEAGLKTCIVVREGVVLTDEEKKDLNTISSFSELLTDAVDGETPAKKVEKEVEPEAVTA